MIAIFYIAYAMMWIATLCYFGVKTIFNTFLALSAIFFVFSIFIHAPMKDVPLVALFFLPFVMALGYAMSNMKASPKQW